MAKYRIAYGIFGQVAEATITYVPLPAEAGRMVRAVGQGNGAFMGFGRTEQRLESELDVGSLVPRRWTHARTGSDLNLVDQGEQESPGEFRMLRKATGQPDRNDTLGRAVLDPLSFLLRLRLTPEAPVTYEVLDGRVLWRAEVAPASSATDPAGFLRLDGRLFPIDWGGKPDRSRSNVAFSLFLTRDSCHTPVRLIVPMGLGDVRADLVLVERLDPIRLLSHVRAALCRALPQWPNCPRPPTSPIPFTPLH